MTFKRRDVLEGIVSSLIAIAPQGCVGDQPAATVADAAPMDGSVAETSKAMDAMPADVTQPDTGTDAGPPGPKAFDQTCNGARSAALPALVTPPALLSLDMAIFDETVGRGLARNGVQVGLATSATDKVRLGNTAANTGTLGRALLHDGDARFRGDIAEVIVFNKALSVPEQHAIKAYVQAHWAFAF